MSDTPRSEKLCSLVDRFIAEELDSNELELLEDHVCECEPCMLRLASSSPLEPVWEAELRAANERVTLDETTKDRIAQLASSLVHPAGISGATGSEGTQPQGLSRLQSRAHSETQRPAVARPNLWLGLATAALLLVAITLAWVASSDHQSTTVQDPQSRSTAALPIENVNDPESTFDLSSNEVQSPPEQVQPPEEKFQATALGGEGYLVAQQSLASDEIPFFLVVRRTSEQN